MNPLEKKQQSKETRATKRTWIAGPRAGDTEKYIDEVATVRTQRAIIVEDRLSTRNRRVLWVCELAGFGFRVRVA